MVFLVDSQGVPSIAPVVRLEKTAGATPDPRVTQSSQSGPATRAWNAFDGDASGQGAVRPDLSSRRSPSGRWTSGESRNIERLTRHAFAPIAAPTRDLWVFTSNTPFSVDLSLRACRPRTA